MNKLLQFFGLITIFSFLQSVPVYAQVGGIVQSSESFSPLKGVNIVVVGTNHGSSTSSDGSFFFDISTFPLRLQFSALGYENQTITIQESDQELVIHLKPSILGLDEIVVSPDRTVNPITNTSSIARSTVSIEQLPTKSVTTAVELLRAETGVFVQQTSVGQGSLYIRGRAGRDVLYLFNGFRMNPSFVRSGQNQYFGAIDPFLISQLDVYRGPVSVYYGSDALSGGVNISPIVKDFSSEVQTSGEVATFLNFQGNGEKTGHAKIYYQAPRLSLFIGGTYRDFDYYNMSNSSNDALWFPYDETLSNADYQFQSYQFSSRINTGTNSNLTLISYNGEIPDAPRLDRLTLGYSIEETDEDLRPQFGYYSNTSPLIFWGNTAEYRLNTSRPAFQNFGIKVAYFRLKDFRTEQDFAFDDQPAFSISNETFDNTFSLSDTTNFDRNESNQIQASLDVQSRITRHLYLKWGGDLSFDKVSSERVSNYGDSRLPRYPDGSEYLLTGIFTQLDYARSQKFSLEYGLRYSLAYANIPFEGIETERQYDPYSDSFGQFTQSLGLTYNLTNNLTLLNNISTGFRAPNVADLSEIGTRGSNQFQTPNTELKPEKTLNFDIGMQFRNDAYSFEIYSFWLHYFDKISRIQTGNTVNTFGEIIPESNETWELYTEVTNENVNSMDLLGVEFAGEYVNSNEIKTGLTFTYTWGNLTNTDGSKDPVDRIPPANGIFYVEYTPSTSISIRPQARYAFAHRRISPSEENDIRVSQDGTDGFVNLQVLINIHTLEKMNVKLVADNIMDVAYREHASSLDGMGRNYTISVSYSF